MSDTIAILGAGALGFLYARELHAPGKRDCFFIAQGERAEGLRQRRTRVNGVPLELPVKEPKGTGEHPVADLLIVALKHHHLEEALPLARPFLHSHTIIISVMNGITSEDIISRTLSQGRVVHCVALGMDAVRSEEAVRYTTPGKLILGKPGITGGAKGEDPDLIRLREIFVGTEVPLLFSDDIIRDQWWKFMINVGVNQVSAVTGGVYRFFQKRGSHTRALMDQAMGEVLQVAEKLGIELGQQDMDRWYTVLDTLGPENKTSMLQDMEAHRKTEVEMFAGTLIDLGERHGLDLPVNRTILGIIRAREEMLFDT